MESDTASTKKHLAIAIKVGFALLFMGGIAWMVKDLEPWKPFARVQPSWLMASLALSFAMVAGSCLKWRLLLRLQGRDLPFLTMLRFYFIGYFFSNLLPSNMGGDFVRSYYAGERIGSQGDAAVSVFLERFTGLLLLLLLSAFGPMIQPELYRHPAVIIPVVLAAGLLGTIVVLIFTDRPLDWGEWLVGVTVGRLPLVGPICIKVVGKARRFHGKLRSAMKVLLRHPGLFLPVMGLTVLFYAATWLNIYVSYRAFAVDPSWPGIIAITAVALLAAMLPLAPLGGLGLVAFSLIYYFSLVGFSQDDSLAMSILLRMKVILLGLIGLVFYLTGSERKKKLPEPDPGSESGLAPVSDAAL